MAMVGKVVSVGAALALLAGFTATPTAAYVRQVAQDLQTSLSEMQQMVQQAQGDWTAFMQAAQDMETGQVP